MITAAQALDVVASADGGHALTPTMLREAAADYERMGNRKDRVSVARTSGRRAARERRSSKDADALYQFAQVARVAADEVERRHCRTVGEANRHPLVRAARRITRRFNRLHAPKVA